MNRKEFLQIMASAGLAAATQSFAGKPMNSSSQNSASQSLAALANSAGTQKRGKRLPALFTSHGNPMDIIVPREKNKFWQTLHGLGQELRGEYAIQAALVVSAHWCTEGTHVNVAADQKQIYDYYGFPKEYYDVYYKAKGAPEIAKTVKGLAPQAKETEEWGLDHGAWPMLMHLFPEGDVPVFQLSIDYPAKPEYHFELGKQLKSLRERGILVIGSGAIVHNIPMTVQKWRTGDKSPYGFEAEYDAWFKQKLDARDLQALIQYPTSHKLAAKAAPTPDHYVPVLYTLGMMDAKDEIHHFHDAVGNLPAFSERSFLVKGG